MSEASPPDSSARGPSLGVWRLALRAAPVPLLLRRDSSFANDEAHVPAAEMLRYASTARQVLKGPLVLEIEGPGDPLASAENVLRGLALVHEHHPDILTGLVIDGPLLNEYARELNELGLNYLVLRMDAASTDAARKLLDHAVYKADLLERDDAARLYIDEQRRALTIAQQHRLPVAVRITLIPTVNDLEVAELAELACRGGAERVDVVGWRGAESGAARGRRASPGEVRDAQDLVDGIVRRFEPAGGRPLRTTRWLHPERFRDVDLQALDQVDVLEILPSPEAETVDDAAFQVPAGRLLPPRRTGLVAVASSDGTLIDRRIEDVEYLRIYLVTPEETRLVGKRTLPRKVRKAKDGVGDAALLLESLVGVGAVVARRFTKRAITLLQAVNVRPFDTVGNVEDVLDRVSRGTLPQAT